MRNEKIIDTLTKTAAEFTKLQAKYKKIFELPVGSKNNLFPPWHKMNIEIFNQTMEIL